MSTETDVFAQITPLITDETISPVELALAAEALNGAGANIFGKILLEELSPQAIASKTFRVATKLRQNDPDYHPYGLPSITYFDGRVEEGLPTFWLRNQNIDINSCWWNIFTENGGAYNNRRTSLNDDYWIRDLDDPDIDRVPGENFTLLSERFPEIRRSSDRTGFTSAEPYIPHELVYPEWFKAHPEYVKTDKILQDELGIDAANLIGAIRDGESSDDVDHMLLGYYLPLLPLNDGSAQYSFNFFKDIAKDKAFSNSTTSQKQTSPCIQYALDKNGLYKESGNRVPYLNNEGNTLGQIKNNNYYWESWVVPPILWGSPETIFKYVDPRDEMNLEFTCQGFLVRKVKGRLQDSYHNKVICTVGKGLPLFPEFTAYADVLYPTDPTQSTFPYTAQQLEAYDDNVSKVYQNNLKNLSSGFISIDPPAYISFMRQKVFRDGVDGFEDWDFETTTDLNSQNNSVYYEEIIIINPRIEYRGIYGAAFKSKKAYKLFHDGRNYEGDSGVYWKTLDKNRIYRFWESRNLYQQETSGRSFNNADEENDFEESDALIIPLTYGALYRLYLKDREEVVTRALCLLTIAIVRRRVSSLKKVVAALIIIFIIVSIVIPGAQAFTKELAAAYAKGELFKFLAIKYLEYKGYELIADEIVELLVDKFGFDLAGQIIAVITVYATFKVMKDPTLLTGDDFLDHMLKMTANFDDSYGRAVSDEVSKIREEDQALQEEAKTKIDEIREIESMLVDPNPNFQAELLVYNIVDESPGEFYNRTIENKNPGVELFDYAKNYLARYKTIIYDELPAIHDSEGLDEEDYLDQLIG
jgi:hypothetical protein